VLESKAGQQHISTITEKQQQQPVIHFFFFSFSLFNVLHSSSLISRLFFSFFEQQNVSELMDFSRALPFEIVEKILRVFFFFFFSPGPEIDELRAALY
jgi:hypothetical protein